MTKIISGTRDFKKSKPVKTLRSNIGEIRCTNQKCKNIAKQVPDGKGGQRHRCLTCGLTFTFTNF